MQKKHSGGIWAFFLALPGRYRLGVGISASVALVGVLLDTVALILLVPTFERVLAVSSIANESKAVQWLEDLFGIVGLDFTLVWMLVVIIVAVSIRSVTLLVLNWIGTYYQAEFEAELKRETFESITAANWKFFLKQRTGTLGNLFVMETGRAGMAYGNLTGTTASLLNVLVYLGVAFVLSWQLTLATLAVITVLMVSFSVVARLANRLGTRATAMNDDLATEFNEDLSGAKIIKSEALERSAWDRLEPKISGRARIDVLIGINNGVFLSATEVLFFLVMIGGVLFSSRVLDLPAATVMMFSFLFIRMYQRARMFQSGLIETNARVPGVWAVKQMVQAAKSEAESRGAEPFDGIRDGIRFDDVTFSYDKGNPVLHNVNLNIVACSVVALVGRSGAGKTSIIDLTIGLLQPDEGEVLINGIPLKNLDTSAWRSRLSYVSQDTILFHDSVYQNIAWGREDVAEQDVYDAARLAEAHKFIGELPDGYDTVIGDRGTRLSGGQRQRVALARALVRRPDLLILDEATSELDTMSEARIQAHLETLRGGTTVIVAAHRLSTILSADQICVFESGRLAEIGTADELMDLGGLFYDMNRPAGDSNHGSAQSSRGRTGTSASIASDSNRQRA
jgi:ABC-type multidrug transport system fused ATPase/permease subunit